MENAADAVPDAIREGISTSGQARNWPMNAWWVVAHGEELQEKPILVTAAAEAQHLTQSAMKT